MRAPRRWPPRRPHLPLDPDRRWRARPLSRRSVDRHTSTVSRLLGHAGGTIDQVDVADVRGLDRLPRARSSERGLVFEADVDLVESLGSDLYAYFHIESEGVQSEQLADLVGERLAETGAAGTREGEEQIVARLEPTSKVRRREKAQIWADTAKLHLFDPESGERLGAQPAAATNAD